MDIWMRDGVRFVNPLVADGRKIYNPAPAELEAAGWRQTRIDPPAPTRRTRFTKLSIRRAMRALEIEGKLDNLLAASPTFARDWADAQEIDLADPVLVEALDAGSVTRAEIAAIRRKIVFGETGEA